MKLSKISLACLLATAGLTTGGTASASLEEGFEFNGYFRVGAYSSVENDFKRADFAGRKETLGRLGIEADNDASLNFAKTWAFDDGRYLRATVGINDSEEGSEATIASNVDVFGMGIGQAFVEFEGVSESGIFWAGRREYGKERYIFMTDFFYTDMSGTGVGIVDYEMGDFLIDLAYIASDRTDPDIDRFDTGDAENVAGEPNTKNLNNLMHAFQVGVTYGAWDVSLLAKAMPDNWDEYGNEWAEWGGDVTVTYSINSFFGLQGNAFSKIIAQAGYGLGSGNLLGGTINAYNAYAPGSLKQGEHPDWDFESIGAVPWHPSNGDALRSLTYVGDDSTSARLLIWGGYTMDNGIGFFPSIQGQYNDDKGGDFYQPSGFVEWDGYNYWVSAMMRNTFPVSQHFYVQTEVGYEYSVFDGSSTDQAKFTIAPTFILPTGLGPAPEIRFLASYLPEAWTNPDYDGDLHPNGVPVDSDSDVILGVQADVWW